MNLEKIIEDKCFPYYDDVDSVSLIKEFCSIVPEIYSLEETMAMSMRTKVARSSITKWYPTIADNPIERTRIAAVIKHMPVPEVSMVLFYEGYRTSDLVDICIDFYIYRLRDFVLLNYFKDMWFFGIDESREDALKLHVFDQGVLFSEAYIEVDRKWITTICHGPGYQLKSELLDKESELLDKEEFELLDEEDLANFQLQ